MKTQTEEKSSVFRRNTLYFNLNPSGLFSTSSPLDFTTFRLRAAVRCHRKVTRSKVTHAEWVISDNLQIYMLEKKVDIFKSKHKT